MKTSASLLALYILILLSVLALCKCSNKINRPKSSAMLIKIDKKERDTLEKMCTLSNCKVNFFTIENNILMIQAEILELNGEDISNESAWYIGRSVAWSMATNLI